MSEHSQPLDGETVKADGDKSVLYGSPNSTFLASLNLQSETFLMASLICVYNFVDPRLTWGPV